MNEKITRGDDRKWRRTLFLRKPHCHWCDIKVVWPNDCAYENQMDMATIDHVLSRIQCETQKEYRARSNRVLACFRCNSERNNSAQKGRPCLIERPVYRYCNPPWPKIPVGYSPLVPAELSAAFSQPQ